MALAGLEKYLRAAGWPLLVKTAAPWPPMTGKGGGGRKSFYLHVQYKWLQTKEMAENEDRFPGYRLGSKTKFPFVCFFLASFLTGTWHCPGQAAEPAQILPSNRCLASPCYMSGPPGTMSGQQTPTCGNMRSRESSQDGTSQSRGPGVTHSLSDARIRGAHTKCFKRNVQGRTKMLKRQWVLQP